MNITRTVATAAVAALVTTGAAAGGYSKSGPATAEPMISAPAAPSVSPRFNWTGAYAGAALGYGRMNIRGADNRSMPVGGFFAGYRYDTGGVVVGGELLVAPATLGSAELPNGERIRSGASLMLTAGMPVTADARTLAFVAAGPSVMRTTGDGGSKTSTGATVGVGIDHMVTDSVMVRGAITYSAINNLSNDNYNTRTLAAGVGVGFKF